MALSGEQVARGAEEIRLLTRRLRGSGRPVVFVPTMGDLHDGHLSLVRAGSALGPVVVSIFVNPTQFGPGEDFDAYPRDLARDLDRLAGLEVAAVFAPDANTLYPDGSTTWVEVEGLTDRLCGAQRPGHFRGVTTVVAKLFGLVRPDVAVFGQKDAQQCLVIQRMVHDLGLPVSLLFAPTVREPDGLAMSSRNHYLDETERRRALALSRALAAGEAALASGERDVAAVEAAMHGMLADVHPEYAELRTLPDLDHPALAAGRVLLAVAARVGRARLIDNRALDLTDEVTETALVPGSTAEAVAAAWQDSARTGGWQ